jgi:hypothetical protein
VPAQTPAPAVNRTARPQSGIMDRVRNFFRKLAGKTPCAGTGCG